MKLKLFLKEKTLFRHLFGIILLISLIPLALGGYYFIVNKTIFLNEPSLLFFCIMIGIIILLAMLGAYYISVKINRPIKQLTKSATESPGGIFHIESKLILIMKWVGWRKYLTT